MSAKPEPFPMFPLGGVLLPTAVLPLHIFEPRYRALVADCLDDDREFGVTLIERGSEVGGGDVRTDLGTVAQILEAQESSDGRWFLATVGTRRFRVVEWLEDDPYPRALIEEWPDRPASADLVSARRVALEALESIAEQAARLQGQETSELPEIAGDPGLASYQISALAPFGPLDRQRLLAAAGPEERFGLLDELLGDLLDDLRLRLELEDD